MNIFQRFQSLFISTFTKRGRVKHIPKFPFCKHNWQKFMGPSNAGNGKFAQNFICTKCGKRKRVVR